MNAGAGSKRFSVSWFTGIVAVVFVVSLILVSVWSVGTQEPHSAFTPDGNGPVPLVEDAHALDLEALRLLSGVQAMRADPNHDPAKTLLVVVAPDRGYTHEEVTGIQSFLHQGGRLLVADNFGAANTLTVALGVTLERVRLFEQDADGIVAVLDRREYRLANGSPTALHPDPGLDHEVLSWSSERSFLDRDGDGLIQAGDPLGPFPIGISTQVGSNGGLVVVFSDPGFLLPEGADEADNRRFRQALLDHLLPEGGRVLVDESRRPTPDPWLLSSAVIVGVATDDSWRVLLGALVVGLFVLGFMMRTRGEWKWHRFSVDHFIRRAELLVASSLQGNPGKKPVSTDPDRRVGSEGEQGEHGTGQDSGNWTKRGKAALLGGLVLGVFGLMLGNLQATYVAGFLLAASALALWARPVRVNAQRRFATDRVHEEMTTPVDLVFKSASSCEVEVRDALPQEFDLVDGHNWFVTRFYPKSRRSLRYEIKGALRGPYNVGPLKVRTSDPFCLRTVESLVLEEKELLVIPRHKPLSRIPFKSKTPVLTMGPHLVNRAGDGTEFHALRDYQSGDSIRIVNWKASARSKGLVVNQRVHESMATITVLLDARAVTGAGQAKKTPLNEGCRAVLSIVTGALQARDKVRVFVYGDGVRELCPGPGTQKAYEMSKAMAGLEPRGSTSLLEAVREVLPELKTRTPVVVVSPLEGDDSVADGIKTLGQRELLPFVLALEIGTAPENPEKGGPEPDARELLARREAAISEIRGADVPVVPVVPGIPLNTLFQVGVA